MHGSSPILLTGFEPFGGEALNPAAEIVRALEGETIAGHRVAGAILPVAFATTLTLLEDLLARHQPTLVLAIGQAGGRACLGFERVAVNLVDARIADNEGLQPIDMAVVDHAPAAYLTTLPVKAMVARANALGIPASLSMSAGSFVCNQVFYALAHLAATRQPALRTGFVHVPWLPEQAVGHAGEPSMALATMVAGVRAALECALDTRTDLAVPGGTTH